MPSFKKYILVLSLTSFISAILIAILILHLLVNDGPINIVTNKIGGMKVAAAAGLVHCLLNFMLYTLYSPKTNEDRSHIQIMNIIKGFCLLIFACLFIHVIAICFGAPVLTQTVETFHFAMLLTVLVCLPFCLFFGPSIDLWMDLFISNSHQLGLATVVYCTSICALAGSWLGAIPIPLDWDRPWQEWPTTCVVGAMGGYSLGLLLSAVQLPMKYRTLHKSKFF